MKLHVWTDSATYQVCVFAADVADARRVALLNLEGSDESSPNRLRVIERVKANNPEIWQHNPVAFVCVDEGGDESRAFFT